MSKSILKWVDRFKVTKEDGHVAYYDLLEDTVTGVQYFATKEGLYTRLNQDGTPVVNYNEES